MSFLNVFLLAGGLAFLGPLIIHLWNRSQFRTVEWAAMHLLDAAVQTNSRRVQWRSFWLLLIRCLIPILLAICLARPVLTQMRVAGSQGQAAIAVVLDDSVSMSVSGQGEESYLAQAQAEIEQLVAAYPRAAKQLFTTGLAASVTEGSTVDNAFFLSAVERQSARAGSNQLRQTISAAIAELRSTSDPNKQLLIASDFAAADWQELSASDMEALRSRSTQADFPIQISLLDVSQRSQAPDNLAISFGNPLDTAVLPEQIKELRVNVRNLAAQPREDVEVRFTVDEQLVSSQTLNLAAQTEEQLAFRFSLGELGWHVLECSLDDEQGLQFDNVATQVIEVHAPKRVLIVAPRLRQDTVQPANYLALALAPYAGLEANRNRFAVQVVGQPKLDSSLLTDELDAIVLCGVPRLSDSHAAALVGFVDRGGGLLVFAGDELDGKWYRQRLIDETQLLPRAFGQRESSGDAQELARARIPTPELQIFNTQDAGDIYELSFRSWFALDEIGGLPETENQELVALRLQDGSPWLVSKRYGEGVVMQCATNCGSSWTNLPLKPVYVPLMQQLVWTTISTAVSANVMAGDSVNVTVSRQQPFEALTLQAFDRSNAATREDEVFFEKRFQFEQASTRHSVSVAIPRTGLVEWAVSDMAPSSADSALSITPPILSSLLSPAESTTEYMNDKQMQDLAQGLDATIVTTAVEFKNAAALREHGREIWRWLLLLLLVFLFAEILLGRSLTTNVG